MTKWNLKRSKHDSFFLVTFFLVTLASFALLPATINALAFSGSQGTQARVPSTQQSEVRELKTGVPIERKIAAGESHSYRVALVGGQYVRFVIDQRGIDLAVRLFGPDGKQTIEVDNLDEIQGAEPVYIVAEATGEYRLDVMAVNKGAEPGHYEVKIEDSRNSTAEDSIRVAAQRALAEAGLLRRQQTPESLRRAIEKFDSALPLLRAVGDRHGEAFALSRIGEIHWQIGYSSKAIEFYNQALRIWRDLNDRAGEGTTLIEMGTAQGHLGNIQEALNYYQQALTITRAFGNRLAEAESLLGVGDSYVALGELQKALECFNQCLLILRSARDKHGEMSALHGIARIYWYLGEPQKALEYYGPVLEERRKTGDRRGEGVITRVIGDCYASMGQQRKALEHYTQALPLHQAAGDQIGEAVTVSVIGQSYVLLGDPQKALEYFKRALNLQREMKDRRGEALTLSHIGGSYSLMRKPEEALSCLEQALALHRQFGDRINEIGTLQRIARIERDQGRLELARNHTEAALNIIESLRSKLISQELRTSFSASKQDYYSFYIDLLMRMHQAQKSSGYDVLAFQASERARARTLLEILTESRADIRQGVHPALLERERSLQQQLNAKAERLTRLLSDKHAEDQEAAARKEVEDLLAANEEIEGEIRAKSPRYAALTQAQSLSLNEIQNQVLDKDTLLLEFALGEDQSYLWAVTPTSIKSFVLPKRADIQAEARRVYDTLTARNKRISFEKKQQREVRIAQADNQYLAASARLSDMLLGPVADELGNKRLLIVGQDALQYVPFGALPIPRSQAQEPRKSQDQSSDYRPLIVEHEVLSLPSASTMALLRTDLAARHRSLKSIAILADPVFKSDDPRVSRNPSAIGEQPKALSSPLPETREFETEMERSARDVGEVDFRRLPYSRLEAEAIAALTPKGTTMESLDFDANRSSAMSGQLSNYRIIHFATHAFLNNQHPELSGIVLSLVDKEGRPQDGFLRLHDIYNLQLEADLVVLSACRTALGKEVKGEGLLGLTRGFMYAGAPRVIASLWAVDDEATAIVMKRFYRQMLVKQQRPAEALRSAQVSILKEKGLPPYYWAAFVLQGEWK
jgi:CHAT domain-containing protein/tetratricopeptide (TPR) repeat protein